MNSFKATTIFVYEHARWFLGRFLIAYITIPLTAAWIVLGTIYDLNQDSVVSAVSGPTYFFIAFLAIAGFKSLFPVAVGMGSTRGQFLKSFYGVGLAGITVCILILNGCQFILMNMSHQILHPGLFILNEFQFMAYVWVDLMTGFLLFGITFLLFCIWYRIGSVRSMVGLMVVIITGMFLYYGGELEWISVPVNGLPGATIAGMLSLAALFLTYPLMKDAPLHPKSQGV